MEMELEFHNPEPCCRKYVFNPQPLEVLELLCFSLQNNHSVLPLFCNHSQAFEIYPLLEIYKNRKKQGRESNFKIRLN